MNIGMPVLFSMMENNPMYFVIVNREDETFLSRISVGASPWISPIGWTNSLKCCLHFTTQEEAQKTIEFMVDVLDWELEDNLDIVRTG